jgi:hypothetical protein
VNSEKNNHFLLDKKITLIYSLYLSIGSIAFFIFINGVYTTIQAKIWAYSYRYMVNSITLTVIPFFASILLFITCFWIVKKKKNAKIFGIIGCLLLTVYPLYVYVADLTVPYNFNYIVIMFIPVVVLFLISIFYWRKI